MCISRAEKKPSDAQCDDRKARTVESVPENDVYLPLPFFLDRDERCLRPFM